MEAAADGLMRSDNAKALEEMLEKLCSRIQAARLGVHQTRTHQHLQFSSLGRALEILEDTLRRCTKKIFLGSLNVHHVPSPFFLQHRRCWSAVIGNSISPFQMVLLSAKVSISHGSVGLAIYVTAPGSFMGFVHGTSPC